MIPNSTIGIKSFNDRLQEPFIFNPFRFGPGVVGAWKELGRSILVSPNANIDVISLADKRYYMILADLRYTASLTPWLRLNSVSTGNPYADRFSDNGASDSTTVSQNQILLNSSTTTPTFSVGYASNRSAQQKLINSLHTIEQNTAGVGNVPDRRELVAKDAQITNPIDAFNLAASTSTFATGSELVILEWDPADIHTDNFFNPLGNASGATLDITLSSAKKYLSAQFLVRAGAAGTVLKLRLGNGSLDSSNLYAFRQSDNGSADTTTGTTDGIILNTSSLESNELLYINVFIINVSANEKLLIIHTVDTNTGVGAGNAPAREEIVAKYVLTSNPINHIGIVATAGSISATSSQGQAWGND